MQTIEPSDQERNRAKPLKQKLNEWNLVKKLNADDVANISAARTKMATTKQHGYLLLRGRLIDSWQRIQQYHKRTVTSEQSRSALLPEKLNNIIVLLGYSNLRPGPLRGLLVEFEALIRETQLILQSSRRASLCEPGNVILDWRCATSETYAWGCQFQLYIWEGIRAFREQRTHWAGICWRSALMQLEILTWLPDIDTWTIFIRSCIRLARFGAVEVGQIFLKKLSWLHKKLPASAPHRSFLNALVNVPYTALVNGGSLLLEAKLRVVETLWEASPTTSISYQKELAEECFFTGSTTCGIRTCQTDFVEPSSLQQLWEEIERDESRLMDMVLNSNLHGAQSLIQKRIRQLQSISSGCEETELFQTLCPRLWAMLGHLQFFQDDKHTEAQASYAKAFSLNDTYAMDRSNTALEMPHMHRTWFILKWIATNMPEIAMYTGDTCDVKMQEIENELEARLVRWSDSGFSSVSGQRLLGELLELPQQEERMAMNEHLDGTFTSSVRVNVHKVGQLSIGVENLQKPLKLATKPRHKKAASKPRARDNTGCGSVSYRSTPGIGSSKRPAPPSKPVTPWT